MPETVDFKNANEFLSPQKIAFVAEPQDMVECLNWLLKNVHKKTLPKRTEKRGTYTKKLVCPNKWKREEKKTETKSGRRENTKDEMFQTK